MWVVPVQAEIAARFAENLTRCRKRADMSQEQLGYRASLHRTEISQLERGMRVPRIDTLIKLAGSLAIPADALLNGIAWTPGAYAPGGFDLPPSTGSAADGDAGGGS
jgi:transcriptional regulator with XRE-family HTH domain